MFYAKVLVLFFFFYQRVEAILVSQQLISCHFSPVLCNNVHPLSTGLYTIFTRRPTVQFLVFCIALRRNKSSLKNRSVVRDTFLALQGSFHIFPDRFMLFIVSHSGNMYTVRVVATQLLWADSFSFCVGVLFFYKTTLPTLNLRANQASQKMVNFYSFSRL